MTSAHDDLPPASAPRREQPVVSVVSTATSTALRVDYDGRHPPLELFFVWTSLGWRAPVPASPPRSAIDWSTPDVARGTSHTILPFSATGTATLDNASRVDADELVRQALDAATRLGCRVDRPAPAADIDLRDDAVPTAPEAAASGPGRAWSRRSGGALARVRAVVPVGSLDDAEAAGREIGATVTTDDEPSAGPDDQPRVRVAFEVPASSADSAMKVLATMSHGTPTIEIVTARALAEGRG
jgi:hypothetical protein